ncbi:hypothetical protein CDAR_543291 [Caerostris darwini]|uniref:Uncharacterized protein n=1 Tax=Caerostris darwini TaxID=1538125 RepID=A0AAV4QUQ3_9ARAC|nr:hypothetical protein CDAR_543291 [Caerostris darwini]
MENVHDQTALSKIHLIFRVIRKYETQETNLCNLSVLNGGDLFEVFGSVEELDDFYSFLTQIKERNRGLLNDAEDLIDSLVAETPESLVNLRQQLSQNRRKYILCSGCFTLWTNNIKHKMQNS